jgi:hypothetical protein
MRRPLKGVLKPVLADDHGGRWHGGLTDTPPSKQFQK